MNEQENFGWSVSIEQLNKNKIGKIVLDIFAGLILVFIFIITH